MTLPRKIWLTFVLSFVTHFCAAQLQTGDTLFYTVNGTIPVRGTALIATASTPKIWVDTTTVFCAFLSREGFADTPPVYDTVHVASGFYELRIVVSNIDTLYYQNIMTQFLLLRSNLHHAIGVSSVEHRQIIKQLNKLIEGK